MEIKSVAIQVLHDAKTYLNHIDSQVYSMPQDLLYGASVGQHTRHFLEFFQCLLDQIAASEPVVNYASRKRSLSLETDPRAALQSISELTTRIAALEENKTCTLACSEHFKDKDVTVQSNLERELIYNIEHTIHHLAIIKIGLSAVAPHIALPDHFGVAPSTVKYKQGACAQ